MTIVLIIAGASLLVVATFLAVIHLGRWCFRQWDARCAEREAKQREQQMRRYSMTDLHGVGERE